MDEGTPSERQSWKQEGDALIARQIARGLPQRNTFINAASKAKLDESSIER
jgi:hypothetical protein